MLFARAKMQDGPLPVLKAIEEDMRRGYSWSRGAYKPDLLYEPESIISAEDLALDAQKAIEANERGENYKPRPVLMSRLPGLCAICSATSYRDLAERIWRDYETGRRAVLGGVLFAAQGGFSRWGCIAIFEGRSVGLDPEGPWPLFAHSRLLAVATMEAIARPTEPK